MDWALSHGLVKLGANGGVIHAPFTLEPFPIDPAVCGRLAALTPLYNRLAWRVAESLDFLSETLGPAARDDPFLRRLLELAQASAGAQPLHLAINRSDYFLVAGEGAGVWRALQVELNTIAASYAGLAGRAQALHGYLAAGTPEAGRLLANDPIAGLAEALAAAWKRLGDPRRVCLFVLQPGERNVFDQRLLEFALRERGIGVARHTLEEVGGQGSIREGKLAIGGHAVAVAYLRSGYGPGDYSSPDAWRGRELIERSDAVAVPTAAAQLAGSKKIQQVLSREEVLGRFCEAEEARALSGTFAGLYDPEEPVAMAEGALPAWRAALEFPQRFVLKPQREGGGNNLFDEEMTALLRTSDAAERAAYILMERIAPEPRRSLMVSEGTLRDGDSVSEIGRFGVLLADGETEHLNRDVGYLVRTKAADSREGGVSAGFGHLSSLIESAE